VLLLRTILSDMLSKNKNSRTLIYPESQVDIIDLRMDKQNPIPPYVSYRTFRNFLVQMEKQGLPGRIDRSVLAHKSGSVQSQLFLALRFLGLIHKSGKPTEDIRRLLTGGQRERMAHFKSLLERSYPFVFGTGFDVETATSDQTEEIFGRTGASGETLRRCISFFVAAARESGIQVSSYIKPHRGKKSPSRSPPQGGPAPATTTSLPRPAPSGTTRKVVQLRGGGILTLYLDVDLFDLAAADRKLIFSLIDQIRSFEEQDNVGVASGDR